MTSEITDEEIMKVCKEKNIKLTSSMFLKSINQLAQAFGFSTNTLLDYTATFNNIGPGFNAVGPTCNFSGYSVLAKIVLSLDMLIGRLEIFPILLLFSPSTWKK